MKKLILLASLFLSFSSFAKSVQYTCVVRYYQIDITIDGLSTSMFFKDRMSHQTLYVGYVSRIETQGNFQKYYFYPTNGHESVLTFNAEDIANEAARTSGWIDGNFGEMVYDSFSCFKVR